MSSSKARGEFKKHGSSKLASTQRALQQQPVSTRSRCESQRWRTRPCQVLHVTSLERTSAQQNSSAAMNAAQLGHREHDGSQRRGQQDCDRAELHYSVQDPGVRAQPKRERTTSTPESMMSRTRNRPTT